MFSTYQKNCIIIDRNGLTFIPFTTLDELVYWAIVKNGQENFNKMLEEVPKMLEKGKEEWSEE